MRFLKVIILLVFFSCSINSITAQNDLPRSTFNIGAGVGQNYGIIGIKSVIGIKNSGLLLGIGTIPGTNLAGYAIGAQISEDWLFVNLSYGTIGSFKVNNGPWEPIEAGNVMIGAMLSVSSSKRAFIELSLGHSFAATPAPLGPFGEADQNGVTFGIGLNFRIGTASTKSAQGD